MAEIPRVACVIVHYRSPNGVLQLISSLEQSALPIKTIYVVDNHSGEEYLSPLRKHSTRFQLISSARNLGFAGGINMGIKRALQDGTDFVWCLAQDMTVEPDTLTTLVQLWPRLQKPGLLGAVTDYNNTDKLYFFRAFIDRAGNVRHKTKGRKFHEIPELKELEYGQTDYVNGACMFTHVETLRRLGPMPEDYYLYFEDAEWGLRAKQLGLCNYVSYKSRVHHHRPDETEFNVRREYYCRRNLYFFKKRNGFYKPWTKFSVLGQMMRHLVKASIKTSLHPTDEQNKAFQRMLRLAITDVWHERLGPQSLVDEMMTRN